MPISKPKKEARNEGGAKEPLPALSQLLAQMEAATAYGMPEPEAEETGAEAESPEPGTPSPETEKDFAEAYRGLEAIRRDLSDRSLSDLVNQYLKVAERKHRAWLWLLNYPDASLPEQDRIWADLQAADEEAAPIREELNGYLAQVKPNP
jgi:hypothetical protein